MDIARGLGICLVVLGHNQICQQGTLIYALIFGFHMPLFFFLSGYFHKNRDSLKNEIQYRAKKLLLPYYCTAIAFILLKSLPDPIAFYHQELRPILFGVLWGSGGRGNLDRYLFWPPLWFLTSLFLTQVSYGLISRIPYFNKLLILRIVVCIASLYLGQYYLESGGSGYVQILGATLILSENGYPLNLDLIPVTIFYYWMGVEFHHQMKSSETDCSKKQCVIWALGAMLLYLSFQILRMNSSLQHFSGGVMDLNLRQYGPLLTSTMLAVCGVFAVVYVCIYIEKYFWGNVGRVLCSLGKYSLPILIFHHFIQRKFSDIIPNSGFWYIPFIAGIIAPVILARVLIARNRVLSGIYGVSPRSY